MSFEIHGHWQGQLSTEVTHTASGATLETRGPVALGGEGGGFSPIDLFAAALASCATTALHRYAKAHGIEVQAVSFRAEAQVVSDPRKRVARIELELVVRSSCSDQDFAAMSAFAHACPLSLSIHPDIEVVDSFVHERSVASPRDSVGR